MLVNKAGLLALLFSTVLLGQQITIRAGTLLDGKGGTVRNTTLVIEGSRIVKIDPSLTNVTERILLPQTIVFQIGLATSSNWPGPRIWPTNWA